MVGGRPGLPLGAYGSIAVSHVGVSKYKARARYRDRDGSVRTVARFGQSKSDARDKLREALADRQRDTGTGIRRSTTVTELARTWLADVQESTRATNTKQTYRYAVDRIIARQLGGLRLAEVDTRLVDDALKTVRADKGPSAAKTTRAVLNGMFSLAVRHGALEVNPVRETERAPTARKMARALTRDEVDDLTDRLRCDATAVLLDLPDLIDFALATGCRVGECLALRDSSVDYEAGTVEINATAVRVPGVGMTIQERTKTEAGWRVLALPVYAVDLLRRRTGELRFRSPAGVVFGSPAARAIRDPSNTARDLRVTLDRLGYEWVTFHTFRRTVLTWMDDAGLPAREAADQAGHSKPSFTQDVYFGRRVASRRAADVLDR